MECVCKFKCILFLHNELWKFYQDIEVDLIEMINTFMLGVQPNQSLKLTEVAVDDFAAREFAENDMISRYVRAMSYVELALRRRSLAPVR